MDGWPCEYTAHTRAEELAGEEEAAAAAQETRQPNVPLLPRPREFAGRDNANIGKGGTHRIDNSRKSRRMRYQSCTAMRRAMRCAQGCGSLASWLFTVAGYEVTQLRAHSRAWLCIFDMRLDDRVWLAPFLRGVHQHEEQLRRGGRGR